MKNIAKNVFWFSAGVVAFLCVGAVIGILRICGMADDDPPLPI